MKNIIHPTLKAMSDKASPFSGILFAGLILTKDGPKLLEYNTRFGDPETQAILPRLKSDLLELMLKVSEGDLENYQIEFSDQVAISIVLAAKGYPEEYQKNTEIKNLLNAENASKNVIIFHAGTKKQDGKILSQTKKIDAEGVEFKQGQEPIHRTLKLDQEKNLDSNTKTSHAVFTENGVTTRDIVVLSEDE